MKRSSGVQPETECGSSTGCGTWSGRSPRHGSSTCDSLP